MNKKAVPTAAAVRELAILTGAVAIIAAAVYFFLVPSHASVSSISGLGIVLANFVPLPLSAITMILNVVLLVIGFLTCGREFGAKTVYTSILLPAFIGLFERLFPNLGSLTDSQELDVLCYILVVSVGLSILFNRNASSGGLDIVAKIMNKYLHMDLGKAMSLSGMCVALSAALVYDKKTVVLSVLGTYFNGLVLDHFIFDNNIKRRVCIITGKEEELRRFIIEDLHSGATVYESYGAYNMQKRREIITIVDKSEYQKLDIYKRIAALENMDELSDMKDELSDRYGSVPSCADNLLMIALIKSKAHKLGMIEIKGGVAHQESGTAVWRTVMTVYPKAELDPDAIKKLLDEYGGAIQMRVDANPAFIWTVTKKKFTNAKEYLKGLNALMDVFIERLTVK